MQQEKVHPKRIRPGNLNSKIQKGEKPKERQGKTPEVAAGKAKDSMMVVALDIVVTTCMLRGLRHWCMNSLFHNDFKSNLNNQITFLNG